MQDLVKSFQKKESKCKGPGGQHLLEVFTNSDEVRIAEIKQDVPTLCL